MNEGIFYVMELQTDITGSVLTWTFTNFAEAESKFYLILSAAAISPVRKHGAIILNEDGIMLKHEVFTHKVEEQAVVENGGE